MNLYKNKFIDLTTIYKLPQHYVKTIILLGWKVLILPSIYLNDLQDVELVKLLKDARQCINVLNENLTLFVKVILVRISLDVILN